MNSSYRYVLCPFCGKKLFKVIDESLYERIFVWCKTCKKEIEVTKRKSQRAK